MNLNILLFTPDNVIIYSHKKNEARIFPLGEEIDIDELTGVLDEVFEEKVAIGHFLPMLVSSREVLKKFLDSLKPFKDYDINRIRVVDIQGLIGHLGKDHSTSEEELLKKVAEIIKSNFRMVEKLEQLTTFSHAEKKTTASSKPRRKRVKKFNTLEDF